MRTDDSFSQIEPGTNQISSIKVYYNWSKFEVHYQEQLELAKILSSSLSFSAIKHKK